MPEGVKEVTVDVFDGVDTKAVEVGFDGPVEGRVYDMLHDVVVSV